MQSTTPPAINLPELADLLRELAVDASDLAEHYAKESTEHHNNLMARHAAASRLRSKRAYRAAEAIEAAIVRTS
jgi:uncharacterized membrane-anchored protein YhcB (DUF1043 family)